MSALFLLVGSIGFNIYKHSCNVDGTYFSLVVKVDHECEEHVELPPCCQSGNECSFTKSVEEKDCCSDELSHFHIALDYFQEQNDYLFAPVLVSDSYETNSQAQLVPSKGELHYLDPPPLERKIYRSLIQVWTI